MRGRPCLRDARRQEERSGRAGVDRADALQRLRKVPARLYLWSDRLVNHGPEGHAPNERIAALSAPRVAC